MARKKLSRLAEAMLETARDMHRIGVMDDDTYRKILVRHSGSKASDLAKSSRGRRNRGISPK